MSATTPERLLLNLLIIAIDSRERAAGNRWTVPNMAGALRGALDAPDGTVSFLERALGEEGLAVHVEALELFQEWFPVT